MAKRIELPTIPDYDEGAIYTGLLGATLTAQALVCIATDLRRIANAMEPATHRAPEDDPAQYAEEPAPL